MKKCGTPIEAMLVRGFHIEGDRTPEFVNGVQLLSDHHKCLLARSVTTGLSIPCGFYNLAPAGDEDRGPVQVAKEMNAILNVRPHDRRRNRPITGVSEAVHRTLPKITNTNLFQSASLAPENRSRKNVALYVPQRFMVGAVEWLDHKETWDRVKHPGTHEARSTMFVKIIGKDEKRFKKPVLVGVGHAPQIDPGNTTDAREEWVDLIAKRLEDEPRFIFLSDPNGLNNQLADRLAA